MSTVPSVLYLEGYHVPLKALVNDTDKPEINYSHYHLLVYRAFTKPDAETCDANRAATAESAFTAYFGERPAPVDAARRGADEQNLLGLGRDAGHNTPPQQLEDGMGERKEVVADEVKVAYHELDDLKRETRNWKIGIPSAAAVAFAGYLGWFALSKSNWNAADASTWGQLGDFFGGVLNPLVAFAAFFWLTRSVVIQKQELAETKAALIDAAASQEKQVGQTSRSVQMAAITSLNSIVASEISRLERAMLAIDENQPEVIRRAYYQMRHHECLALQTSLVEQVLLSAKNEKHALSLPEDVLKIAFAVEFTYRATLPNGTKPFKWAARYKGRLLEEEDSLSGHRHTWGIFIRMPIDAEKVEIIVNGTSLGFFTLASLIDTGGLMDVVEKINAANPF